MTKIQELSSKLNNLFVCKKEREAFVRHFGADTVWFEQLKELVQMIEDCKAEIKAEVQKIRNQAQAVEINVYFEEGYRWSVNINDGESIDTGLTKRDAMDLARSLKADYPNAKINEQKLTRAERKQNISNLHANGYSYTKF